MKSWILILLSLALFACSEPKAPPEPPVDVKVYDGGVGKVREIVADGHLAIIVHDEIPGFMTAMTMSFELREDSIRNAISNGDSISFQVSFDGIDAWISRVTVIQ